jgi:hypothetical protein
MKRISLISTASRLQAERLKDRGLISGGGRDCLATASKAAVKPAEFLYNFILGGLSLGAKRPVHEVNKSPSLSGKVRKEWNSIPTHPYVFNAWCPIARNSFTLTWLN